MRAALRRRLPDGSDESGTALILALLVVVVVGALFAAAMDTTNTGLLLGPSFRDDRNVENYVQGAVQGGINNVRGSSDFGTTGGLCPDYAPAVPAGLSGVSGHAVKVTCSGLSVPGGAAADAPAYAIQTLGPSPSGLSVSGTNPLYVDGAVYSAGDVTVSNPNGVLRVNGSLDAVGSCSGGSGTVLTTDLAGAHCNPPRVTAGDPTFPVAVSGQAGLDSLIATGTLDQGADPLPDCTSSSSVVTFSPGYYASAPDALLAKIGCPGAGAGKVWNFTAGKYVFDYSGTWLVKGYQVVAGALASGHTASDPLGTACDSGAPGAQFAFEGAGAVQTQSASGGTVSGIEVCGPTSAQATAWSSTAQRVAIAGVWNTATTSPATAVSQIAAPGDPTQDPAGSWVNAGSTYTATNATTGFTQNQHASLVYTFPGTAVPKGAVISAVQLRVNQTLVRASSTVTLTPARGAPVTLTPNQGACATGVPTPCGNSTSILGNLTSSTVTDVPWRTLDNGFRITYTATASNDTGQGAGAHSAIVRGLDLLVTYSTPTYYKQATGAFFDSTTNPNVFLHGTVYTPAASWNVQVQNSGTSIFDRGIVAYSLAVNANASSKQTTSPFELPHGPPNGRLVLFQGYLDSVERVRACVLYGDSAPNGAGGTSAYAGYSVTVQHWLYEHTPSGQPASC